MSTAREPSFRVRGGRTAGTVVAVGLALSGCSEPVVPEPSAVTAQDLERVRDEVADLEDRVAILEDRLAGDDSGGQEDESGSPDTGDSFFGDPASSVGRQVAVRGEVAGLLASTDVASAFRIAGDGGEPVAVVSVTPSPELATGDVVEVSGTAVEVDRDTFEADFGIAADALFEDPDAWFADAEGEVAIAADRIEVLQAPARD